MNIKTHIGDGKPGQRFNFVAAEVVSRFALKRKRIARYQGQRALLRHAFALKFNHILLAISPSDTPEDLISRFNATLEAEDAEYQASPMGMAAKAEMDRKIQDAQAETTSLEAALPATLEGPLSGVVEWMMRFVVSAGWVRVTYDADNIGAQFKDAGFKVNDFVGDDFKDELQSSPDALGRYLIGQFLDLLSQKCGFPDHLFQRFVEEYREMVAEA